MENEYLPIGSVVLLKNASKKVMITGFYVSSQEVDSDKVYDYVGCLYPEGIIPSSQNLVFNNDQISQIVFVGYRDIEEQLFKEELFKKIKENNNKSEKKDNDKIDHHEEKDLKIEEMETSFEEEPKIEKIETSFEEEPEIEEIETSFEEEPEIEEMETSFEEEPKIEEMETPFDDDLDIESAGILFDEEPNVEDISIPLDEEKIIEKTNLNNEKIDDSKKEEDVIPSIYDELEVLDPDKLFVSKKVEQNDDLEIENGKFIDFENDSNDIYSFNDDLLYGNDDDSKELEKIDF